MKSIFKCLRNNYLITILLIIWISLPIFLIFDRKYELWPTLDSYCRALLGYKWHLKPYLINPQYTENALWPPFQFFIIGIGIKVFKDIFITSSILGIVFSLLTLIILFKLCELLFDKKIAFFAVLLGSMLSTNTLLAVSGMPRPYFNFFVIAAFYFLLLANKTENYRLFYLSSFFLALANTVRYESWGLTFIWSAVIIYWMIKFPFKKTNIIGNLLILWIFPIFWVYRQYIFTHDMLISGRITANDFAYYYSQWNEYYPKFIPGKIFILARICWVREPILLISGTVAFFYTIISTIKNKKRDLLIFTLLLGLQIIFVGISTSFGLISFGVEERFLFPWLLLVIPLIIKLLDDLIGKIRLFKSEKSVQLILILLLSFMLFKNIKKTLNYRYSNYAIPSLAGAELKKLWGKGVLDKDSLVLLEDGFWTYYPVAIHSNHPLNVYALSAESYKDRIHAPSSSRIPLDELKNILLSNKNRKVVLLIKTNDFEEKIISQYKSFKYYGNLQDYKMYFNLLNSLS